MNWVKTNRKILELTNYVRKADAKTGYWVDFSYNKIASYRRLTNDCFDIIVYGDDVIETDFYSIPYIEIAHILVEENLTESAGRRRWIGNIVNQKLILSRTKNKLNIAQYYSLTRGEQITLLKTSSDAENDFAIENAKREVLVRINQSVFRQKVLENFNYKCCLTGVNELPLLVASHIIPWASKIECRLSPHNGLCFSILYDKLFNKGYFTISRDLTIILTPRLDSLSHQTKSWLLSISGKSIAKPRHYVIGGEFLEYHRLMIFDKF